MKEAIEYGRVQLSETCITTPVTLFFFPLVVCIQAHSLTHSLTRSITQSLTYSLTHPVGKKEKSWIVCTIGMIPPRERGRRVGRMWLFAARLDANNPGFPIK